MTGLSLSPIASLILAVILLLASAPTQAAGGVTLILQTDDGPRTALLMSAGPGPRPTVIVLHGAGGSGAEIASGYGFVEAAGQYGFNAVFPDGLRQQWHDGRYPSAWRPDDVAYLTSLVGHLTTDGIALQGSIYLIGFSNGGMMSLTLACKAADLFAGIATVGAAMPAPLQSCPLKPGRLIMFHGTADPIVPYTGGEVGGPGVHGGMILGVEQTAALFAQADECTQPIIRPMPDLDPTDGTDVTQIDWAGCLPRTSVTIYRVDGGGHTIPGTPSADVAGHGLSNNDIVAAQVIMAAFAAPY